MWFKSATVILMLAMLAGCSDAESDAEDLVRAQLTDPASATFRNVRSVRDEYGVVGVCGEVNAKNRMGGYVGFVEFMAKQGEVVIRSRDDASLGAYQVPYFRACTTTPPTVLTSDEREAYEAFKMD